MVETLDYYVHETSCVIVRGTTANNGRMIHTMHMNPCIAYICQCCMLYTAPAYVFNEYRELRGVNARQVHIKYT